jgi:hypothetical protein
MNLEQLRTRADAIRERLNVAVGVAVGLKNGLEMDEFDLSLHGKLLLIRRDYPSLLELLRDLAAGGQRMEFGMQWSSGESVLFSWESPAVTVWLTVTPDTIPPELMGPECRLVKTEITDVQYSMVCER